MFKKDFLPIFFIFSNLTNPFTTKLQLISKVNLVVELEDKNFVEYVPIKAFLSTVGQVELIAS